MDEETMEKLRFSKILMIGAGGIGCELLKNLVLAEFGNIDVVDLDTIDVSNLNRQFLFQRQHVGRSKAEVAVESVEGFNRSSKIKHYHASIQDPSFDVNFFEQYDLVLNALDNRAARNHVNRLCLAADIPLIESGSAGFLGQVGLIKKGVTECYECQPKVAQRTYPGCTIRNTPSEPIHCILWAKHLFNQLFGAADPDEDVSPDMSDPELQKELDSEHSATNGGSASNVVSETNNNAETERETLGNVLRISTRKWASENAYDSQMLFTKFFYDDVNYLLSMENLWKKRTPPSPLPWTDGVESEGNGAKSSASFDQEVWSVSKCRQVFADCVDVLKEQVLETKTDLVWDKDDDVCVNFVTACANIRAHCFHIQMKSRFDVKSMAGNIIPAIATTNAIIAGLIVVEAVKVLTDRINECVTAFLVQKPNLICKFIATSALDPPNPKCYVCSTKPEVIVKLNCATFTVNALAEKVLKQRLNMVAPDVEIDDNSGRIIISSDEEETSDLQNKTLSELSLQDGTRLKCDDFLQRYELRLIISHALDLPQEIEFEILTDTSSLKAQAVEASVAGANADEEDDLVVIEDVPPTFDNSFGAKKRKAEESRENESEISAKRAKAPL